MQNIAIVGATNDKNKYGNKILNDLVFKGYTVYPVNPYEDVIEGIKSYSSISDLKSKNVDTIVFVLPPNIALQILKDNKIYLMENNIQLWFQPGASNDNVKKFLIANNFKNYILDACIMLN